MPFDSRQRLKAHPLPDGWLALLTIPMKASRTCLSNLMFNSLPRLSMLQPHLPSYFCPRAFAHAKTVPLKPARITELLSSISSCGEQAKQELEGAVLW